MNKSKKRVLNEAGTRAKCYTCYRPFSSCMCSHITKIDTDTKFVILMHDKEFKKTKNGTGIFSHLSLPNSKIFMGIDFTNNSRITKIVEDKNNNCYILYPSTKAQSLNETNIKKDGKKTVIFIIDSTWACAKKIMRVSKNIKNLPHISFSHDKRSLFHIKKQPLDICLSTMESIHCVLEILDSKKDEQIQKKKLDNFLNPFHEMVKYQMKYTSY